MVASLGTVIQLEGVNYTYLSLVPLMLITLTYKGTCLNEPVIPSLTCVRATITSKWSTFYIYLVLLKSDCGSLKAKPCEKQFSLTALTGFKRGNIN